MLNKKIIAPLLFALILAGCNNASKTSYYSDKETNMAQSSAVQGSTETNNSMTIPEQINQELSKEYSGATIVTTMGNIEVSFYEESPITVSNFLTLAQEGFYDGTLFHRVIKDFMIQGGDPNSKNPDRSTHGSGGPNYRFDDEFNTHLLVKGSLAMANAGPGTNGSQFFIVTAESTPWLNGKHTNFGYVKAGMDVVEKIQNVAVDSNDHPIDDVEIKSIALIKK
jgi:cyclophilin family peptidyl-prolyl cis-trans isomerase